MIDRIWAGWRSDYVSRLDADDSPVQTTSDGSLFERLYNASDDDHDAHIVRRGVNCFAILNRFPYATGHVLVMPNRAVPTLAELTDAESAELWGMTQDVVAAIHAAYKPEGVNVGMNLGRAAGAGVPDHLHMHCLPRWSGDTNFTTAVAETRVLPEALDVTWTKLREAWPR